MPVLLVLLSGLIATGRSSDAGKGAVFSGQVLAWLDEGVSVLSTSSLGLSFPPSVDQRPEWVK